MLATLFFVRERRGLWALSMLGSLAACGHGRPATTPAADMQRAQGRLAGTLAAAEGLGATEQPAAAHHLRLARAQGALAERLLQHQSPLAASRSLERAQSDASLALALAREVPAAALAQDAVDQLEAFHGARLPGPAEPTP